MFKKINAVFRPNRGSGAQEDYHSACTVKLVRSASMLAVGERSSRAQRDSTLKRSASAYSVYSSTALYYYHSREERVWLYSQNQECLEYLQELVALRRRYTKSVSDLKQGERREQTSRKKKPAPQPPQVRKCIDFIFVAVGGKPQSSNIKSYSVKGIFIDFLWH